ncbi:hypothetical protein [Wohlfahrtiimonas chitiniclastica]|uniref:hypothetical protein n=1 Tax=Wohlfahrtiimonas chitiniclastica TaxID=400946 RepID=UPI000B9965A4|nr:hypothetical protein [Wohlfahrtiimonas chitiniclastica]OYQ76096.1 hypothetical protein B9T18_01695 [Wohlfahrtiimonas chitiniclastica]
MSLIDLDELLLKCRDKSAREYINDAIKCYKAGAYRASIVSTWLAVMYDIINKLQELSLSNDAAARVKYEEYQKSASKAELSELLKFERTILKYCLNDLNIISHIEFNNLERIREDRNKCAHPSVSADNEIFQPTPELARQHIRIAVESLLAHPPAQGTKALESLIKIIQSEYFPKDLEQITQTLQASPLHNARTSLVRNFVIICLKEMFNQSMQSDIEKYYNILKVTNNMYPDIYVETLNTKISNIIRSLDDQCLSTVLKVIIQYIPDLYSYLETDIQIKLIEYIKQELFSNSFGHLPETVKILEHKDFAPTVQSIIDNLSSQKIANISWLGEPEPFMYDVIIKRYCESKSFSEANELGKILKTTIKNLTIEQLSLINKAAQENSQISGSTQWEQYIKEQIADALLPQPESSNHSDQGYESHE